MMSLINLRQKARFVGAALALLATSPAFAGVGGYRKATEGEDVIKNKMYPKSGRVELNGLNVGKILNQSYIDTYVLNGGVNYFWSETWGLGVEMTYAINQDRPERECIENFYNDPDYEIGPECGSSENISNTNGNNTTGNYGPAYVNIREYNYLFSGHGIWNPIYGKEIFFLSGVVNFDVFVTMGGGLAMSTFYPLDTKLKNGKESRGTFPPDGTAGERPGTEPDEEGGPYYGKEGRPDPQKQTNIFLEGGVGQKVHFGKKFHAKAELRNHLVLGTPGGFDMFFTLWGGVGMRF
jgi:outer membrane beta-barrel protein